MQEAVAAWQLLSAGASGGDAANGHYHAALLLSQSGDKQSAEKQLHATVAAAPTSYYAARARDALGDSPMGTTAPGSTLTKEERREVEQWIASWTKRPAVHVDDGWLPDIARSPETLRARELGALDLRDEARDEWFAAKERWDDAPEHLWQLGLLATLEQQPYVALKAAERIVALSPSERITPETPRPLLRLIFPTPYSRVARQYAQEADIDPRLLYAFLRQESLFNPDAHSWAGARGLAQVMPETGAGIAQALEIAPFDPDLLFQPAISLRFGAFYFARQLRAFDGSIQAAAAAYNGGPGNAARWREISTDPDQFPEVIDYHETRDYVKRVYGNWGVYRTLYAR
jgi:soluble lytic murein transglycosylase